MDYDKFGIEAFYQDSGEEKSDRVIDLSTGNIGKIKTSFEAYGIDAMAYAPAYENAEVFGAIGWGQYKIKAKGFGMSGSERENAVRFGVGLQYNFNEHFALRTTARYARLNSDFAKNIGELSLGGRYSF
ncbi:MAG: outer membrane beta-barrel protein [Alphaproteobacteria bacterium]|nr:outer membrane beta-barrel protein [Alphaproteobacteria bacterium]